jgi:hypothetical protein
MTTTTTTDPITLQAMARLSAALREHIPPTDQWQVYTLPCESLSGDYEMILVDIRRTEGDRKLRRVCALSPRMILQAKVDLGQHVADRWLHAVAEASDTPRIGATG